MRLWEQREGRSTAGVSRFASLGVALVLVFLSAPSRAAALHETGSFCSRFLATNAHAADPSPADQTVFHGNRRSKVYHRDTCRNYNCPNCIVVFTSHEEAQKAGFRPSGDCFR